MQSIHIPGVAVGIVQGDKIVHLQRFGVAKPAGQLMTAHTPPCWGLDSFLKGTQVSAAKGTQVPGNGQ